MSEASDAFNALPIEQRILLGNLILEHELRLIDREQERIKNDCRRALNELKERAKRITLELERRKVKECAA